MQFLSHFNYISSGYHIGQCRSRTLPSPRKVLLDDVHLESLSSSPKQNVEPVWDEVRVALIL